jgi:hypothetical protein
MFVDQHQPDRPLTHFGGKLVRRFAHDGSSFSGVEPSGKPSAVQEGAFRQFGSAPEWVAPSTVSTDPGLPCSLKAAATDANCSVPLLPPNGCKGPRVDCSSRSRGYVQGQIGSALLKGAA